MTSLAYLAALLGSLSCMMLMDRRWRLFLWAAPRRATVVLALGWVFFLLWDVAALREGLYWRGESAYMTGIEVAPELPLEELLFLLFLPYVTMVAHGLAQRALTGLRSDDVERVG